MATQNNRVFLGSEVLQLPANFRSQFTSGNITLKASGGFTYLIGGLYLSGGSNVTITVGSEVIFDLDYTGTLIIPFQVYLGGTGKGNSTTDVTITHAGKTNVQYALVI